MESLVLNFACDLFIFYSPHVQTLLVIYAWAQGLEEAPPLSAHPWVRRKESMLGMALIGGKILIRIYSLVSMLREGRQGIDKEMTAIWPRLPAAHIYLCVCIHPLCPVSKPVLGLLMGE